MTVTDLRQRLDVAEPAQIVGAGDIDRHGLAGQGGESLLQQLRGDDAAAERAAVALWKEPFHLEVKESCGVNKSLVDVSGGDDEGLFAALFHGGAEIQHGADALAAALGGEERPSAAEELGGDGFALRDDAVGFVEGIGALDFRDVKRLITQQSPTFMAGHVETCCLGFCVTVYKVADGGLTCGHLRQPSS